MPELEFLKSVIDKKTLAVVYPFYAKSLVEKLQETGGWVYATETTPKKEIETSKRFDMLQKQIDCLTHILTNRPMIRNAVLRDLNSNKYSLKENIEILIEEYPDETIALWPEIEAFGHGFTQPEAILDLKNEIIDLYEDLSNTKKKELGKLPEMWLRILKKITKKND